MEWVAKFKGKFKGLCAGALSALLALAAPLHADTTVFAAASLRGVLDDLSSAYGQPVTLSYGGSGTIARQVGQGAPADVIVLAHPRWMDWLAARGTPGADGARIVAQNTLVVIGPAGAPPIGGADGIAQALGTGRLAMGNRDAVPAGIYAREWLTAAGFWDDLSDQLAETDNVRSALAFVARKEAPLGIVYATDARLEPRVTPVYVVPHHMHSPIRYPAAGLTPKGADFVAFLRSKTAKDIFAAHGFGPL